MNSHVLQIGWAAPVLYKGGRQVVGRARSPRARFREQQEANGRRGTTQELCETDHPPLPLGVARCRRDSASRDQWKRWIVGFLTNSWGGPPPLKQTVSHRLRLHDFAEQRLRAAS